jgi:hypothetical protein
MEEVSDDPITTHTNLLRTMLRVIVALLTGSKVNLVAEPAAKRQPYTRAIRTVPENFDCSDFPVFFDLSFYRFEWHKGIIPHLRENARGTRWTAQFPPPIFYTDIPVLQA